MPPSHPQSRSGGHTGLVLFDLDGTLADTAADLVAAINGCLRERGLPERPVPSLRPWISHGARGLIAQTFALAPGDEGYEVLRSEFVERYARALCVHSCLFPGVAELLTELESRGLRWGIVTNKVSRLTDPLVEQLGLASRAACVVSGDTAARPKPDPAPILLALERCGFAAEQGMYVGDDRRDITAGRDAGVRTVAVSYGYSVEIDDIDDWRADHIIGTPRELLDCLRALGAPGAERG